MQHSKNGFYWNLFMNNILPFVKRSLINLSCDKHLVQVGPRMGWGAITLKQLYSQKKTKRKTLKLLIHIS